MMYKVQTLNQISVKGLERFPRESYELASEIGRPDAILLRSHKLTSAEITGTVLCIGRAGAGTNNIPVSECTERGIPVFNFALGKIGIRHVHHVACIGVAVVRPRLNIHTYRPCPGYRTDYGAGTMRQVKTQVPKRSSGVFQGRLARVIAFKFQCCRFTIGVIAQHRAQQCLAD
jgi:hypothetical protein